MTLEIRTASRASTTQLSHTARSGLVLVLIGKFRRSSHSPVRSATSHTGTSISIALKCAITKMAELRTERFRCTVPFSWRTVGRFCETPIHRADLSRLGPTERNADDHQDCSDASSHNRNYWTKQGSC